MNNAVVELKGEIARRLERNAAWMESLQVAKTSGKITEEEYQRKISRAITANEIMAARNAIRANEHRRETRVDSLTNLPNRRALDEELILRSDEVKNGKYQLGVLMLDVDHFKRINDTKSHVVGDKVLKWIGQILHQIYRSGDFVARYGGEEFVVLLINPDNLEATAERYRIGIQNGEGEPVPGVTISVGATIMDKSEDISAAIKRADDALYKSKQSGRNRSTILLTDVI